MGSKRIGLFGGSFDPVHAVHVQLALETQKTLNLDEVWVLIDKEPRGKKVIASYYDRLEMVRLATAEYGFIKTDILEMQKRGRTYNLSALQELILLFPGYTFTLIVGMDALLHLSEWDDPAAFCKIVDFAVAKRPIVRANDIEVLKKRLGPAGNFFRYTLLDIPESSVSSRGVREDLKSKKVVSSIHPNVQRYAQKNNLYDILLTKEINIDRGL